MADIVPFPAPKASLDRLRTARVWRAGGWCLVGVILPLAIAFTFMAWLAWGLFTMLVPPDDV